MMKLLKRRTAQENSKERAGSGIWKNPGIRAAALGLLLLVEGCAAAPVNASKCECNSPEELRLVALEQRVEAAKQKVEKAKQKIYELENRMRLMKRDLYKKELEQLLLSVKKRSCEKFREELEMVKSLARYGEHNCVENDSFDSVLRAKITVHCPEIEYLESLIRRDCK